MKDLKRVLENMETLENIIKETAPSGSGINDYKNIRIEHYSMNNENKLIMENAYYCINDAGFGDGTLPFRVVIGMDLDPRVHFIKLTPAERYRVWKYDLKNYLEEVYYEYVNDCIPLLEILLKTL